MQFEDLFIAFPIAPPRPNAASAIPVPTIARIKAYSAADAPLSSFQRVLKKVIRIPLSASAVGVLNAVRSFVHRIADRAAKADCRQCNASPNNRQDESIFSRRSAALVAPECFEKSHVFTPTAPKAFRLLLHSSAEGPLPPGDPSVGSPTRQAVGQFP